MGVMIPDDTILNNCKAIAPDLQRLDGGTVKLAGLQPVAEALTDHRHRPTANSAGAAVGGGGVVLRVRRRDRRRPTGMVG